MIHPPHGYRYHNPERPHRDVLYTPETRPHVALGVLAAEARSEGWQAPTRLTQITPWYYEDVRRVPMNGKAGRTTYHE